MCHGVLGSILSAPVPGWFGGKSILVDDSKTGTNCVVFSDLVISWNREEDFLLDMC